MNCDGFSASWDAHVAGTLDDAAVAEMGEHARLCPGCGKKWREFGDLRSTLQAVLDPQQLPADIGAAVTKAVLPHRRIHETLPASPPLSSGAPVSFGLQQVLLAAVIGVVVGFLVSSMMQQGANRQSNAESLMQQFATMQMVNQFGGRPPFLGMGTSSFSTQSHQSGMLLFQLLAIVWLARTRLWTRLFPRRLPMGLALAQWIVLLAALFGSLTLAADLFFQAGTVLDAINSGGNSIYSNTMARDAGVLLLGLRVLDQAWMIGFWLTLFLVMFSLLNELAARYAKPWQA